MGAALGTHGNSLLGRMPGTGEDYLALTAGLELGLGGEGLFPSSFSWASSLREEKPHQRINGQSSVCHLAQRALSLPLSLKSLPFPSTMAP